MVEYTIVAETSLRKRGLKRRRSFPKIVGIPELIGRETLRVIKGIFGYEKVPLERVFVYTQKGRVPLIYGPGPLPVIFAMEDLKKSKVNDLLWAWEEIFGYDPLQHLEVKDFLEILDGIIKGEKEIMEKILKGYENKLIGRLRKMKELAYKLIKLAEESPFPKIREKIRERIEKFKPEFEEEKERYKLTLGAKIEKFKRFLERKFRKGVKVSYEIGKGIYAFSVTHGSEKYGVIIDTRNEEDVNVTILRTKGNIMKAVDEYVSKRVS